MTPKFLTTPWSSSLNDIWRMDSSIQIWWTGTLWRLVLDDGVYFQAYPLIHISRSIFPQYLSWKTLKRQFVILGCILSSRSLWHQTTGWRSGECREAQTGVHQWLTNVRKSHQIQVQTPLKSLRLYRHPVPFKCIITPRTPTAEALVRDSVNKDYWEDSAVSIDVHQHPSNSNNDLKVHVPKNHI